MSPLRTKTLEMDTINITYSFNNIPIPSKFKYQQTLIAKTEKFLRNCRWAVFFFLNPSSKSEVKKTYGFKSPNNPPPMEETREFENDIYNLINNIKYKPWHNTFQSEMKKDLEKIRQTKDIIVKADKTDNLYKMSPTNHNKEMVNTISKEYKKCPPIKVEEVTREAAKIARKFDLEDRIDCPTENSAFITIKDHKPSFPQKVDFRLINPAKNNIASISKRILDNINTNLRKSTNYNQWKNTKDALDWFLSIKNKKSKKSIKFFKFDIVSFYPSISKTLLENAITWAKSITNIEDRDMEVIFHCRKSFLFYRKEPWVKREQSEFDVGMGEFDSAEICELVGLYILHQMKDIIPMNDLGLYRDDGLAVIDLPGPDLERLRQQVKRLFARNGLQVTIEAGMQITDFLDVRLNLTDMSHRPYRKDNSIPSYVHNHSNHPPHIKKELPKMVEQRISKLSSSKDIFDAEAPLYNTALKNAGYNTEIKYVENKEKTERKRKRQRNILWFNPPWNDAVSTNVAAKFLAIVDKHFKHTPLGKRLNRNTVKVSYSCMPNIAAAISSHNHRASNPLPPNNNQGGCNCRGGSKNCVLDGQCKTSSIVYKCVVTEGNNEKQYIGLTANSFKERYTQHKASMKHENLAHSTALSAHIWDLKKEGKSPTLSWSIVKRAPAYSKETQNCQLCLSEKTFILLANEKTSLNKRKEILSKCRHRDKWLLKHW